MSLNSAIFLKILIFVSPTTLSRKELASKLATVSSESSSRWTATKPIMLPQKSGCAITHSQMFVYGRPRERDIPSIITFSRYSVIAGPIPDYEVQYRSIGSDGLEMLLRRAERLWKASLKLKAEHYIPSWDLRLAGAIFGLSAKGREEHLFLIHEGPLRAAKNTFLLVHEGPLRAAKNTFCGRRRSWSSGTRITWETVRLCLETSYIVTL